MSSKSKNSTIGNSLGYGSEGRSSSGSGKGNKGFIGNNETIGHRKGKTPIGNYGRRSEYGSLPIPPKELGSSKSNFPNVNLPAPPTKTFQSAGYPIPTEKEILPMQDLQSLMGIKDFLCLILSYPMKLGYDHSLVQWMEEVSLFSVDDSSQEALQGLLSRSPLRHVKGIIAEDITEQIKSGDSIILNKSNSKELTTATSKDSPPSHVPRPILDLAARLAVHQLAHTFAPENHFSSFNWWKAQSVVCFSTRNNAEKQAVVEDIKANFHIGETFERLQIVHLSQIDKEFQVFDVSRWLDQTTSAELTTKDYDFEVLEFPGKNKRRRNLVLLVDGDDDERVDLRKVYFPVNKRHRKNAVVIITTGSSTLQNDELVYKGDVRIRTQDHALPWEVFWKNVGRELAHSSSAIQRVAVQIVEECGGHLLAVVFASKSLKDVEDVQIWERTLQKLRYRSPSYKLIEFKHVSEVIVNAFINIIWEDVISERKKPRWFFEQCLKAFKLEAKMSKVELFARWFFERLIVTEEEAEHTLRELVETSILQEIEDIYGQYILLPEELKIIVDVMSEEKSHDNLIRGPSGLTEPPKVWDSHEASKFLATSPIKSLNLSYSAIQSLPGFVSKLDQLQTLSLTGCQQFTQLPLEIAQLHHIKELYLDETSIMDLPHSLNCPSLRILSLGNNLNLMEIPPSFFDHLPQLQTLDLSLTSIHDLPRSFYNLQKLEYFHLRDCELFFELSPNIGQLTNLTELDLHGTQVTHLPNDIQKLTKLKTLSLSFLGFHHGSGHENKFTPSSNFAIIPFGALSGLKNLVELCIVVNSDNEWWFENFEHILEEITALKGLRKLDMYIPSVRGVKYVEPVLEKLSFNLKFIVGYHMLRIISRVLPAIEEKFVASNGSLRFVNGEDFPDEVMRILSKAWAFFLDRHMTIKNLNQFGWSNLNQLRLCILSECNEMQSIVDGDEDSNLLEDSFGELKFLTIFYMKNLTSIINRATLGNFPFCKLKFLALHTCPKLTTIFTMGMLYNFSYLEELIVEDCPKVSSIISCQSLGEPTTYIFLPRLRKLSLLFVPELVSISIGVPIGRSLERIGFYCCPKLKSLSSKELLSQKLRDIIGESDWWEALTWSEAEWGQQGRPDKFNHIFSAIDEDLDILTQLTSCEVEAVGGASDPELGD